MVVQDHTPAIVTDAVVMLICIWDIVPVCTDTMDMTVVYLILQDLYIIADHAAQHVLVVATDQIHAIVMIVGHTCTSITGDTAYATMATLVTIAHAIATQTDSILVYVIQYVAPHVMDLSPVTVMNAAIMHTRTLMDTVLASMDTMEITVI
jgi:hypothetical protein